MKTSTKPQPKLIARELVDILDAFGIRPETIDVDSEHLTLRFHHLDISNLVDLLDSDEMRRRRASGWR